MMPAQASRLLGCPAPKSNGPKDSTANIGFEAKLWLAADKLRNNMDAACAKARTRRLRESRTAINCALISARVDHSKPGWRNWQTRQT